MDEREQARKERAEKRKNWPIRKYALTEEPSEDLSDSTTPEERLAMMWELAVQAWLLSGKPMPTYARHESPGRVIRPKEESK